MVTATSKKLFRCLIIPKIQGALDSRSIKEMTCLHDLWNKMQLCFRASAIARALSYYSAKTYTTTLSTVQNIKSKKQAIYKNPNLAIFLC